MQCDVACAVLTTPYGQNVLM